MISLAFPSGPKHGRGRSRPGPQSQDRSDWDRAPRQHSVPQRHRRDIRRDKRRLLFSCPHAVSSGWRARGPVAIGCAGMKARRKSLSLGERTSYRRWKMLLVVNGRPRSLPSIGHGVRRPCQLDRFIPGTSTKVLHERLRKLLACRLISPAETPGRRAPLICGPDLATQCGIGGLVRPRPSTDPGGINLRQRIKA